VFVLFTIFFKLYIQWQSRPLIMWNPRLISEDVADGFNV